MTQLARMFYAALVCSWFAFPVLAQAPSATPGGNPPAETAPKTPAAVAPEPIGNPIAAKVNGQPINETAVRRALDAMPPEERAKARGEVLQWLIENALIDQYLTALKITIEPKDIDGQLNSFKEECKKHSQDYTIVLKRMRLTEDDLKEQIQNQLRWEKFVNQQATDQALENLFKQLPEGFDNSAVRARHILLAATEDPAAKQETVAKLRALKQQIEKEVNDAVAKLPADIDNVEREKKRQALLEDAFSNAAKKFSTCPSKNAGGDLLWFPRIGSMVEPFAKAAFALQPYQMSDVVATQFGYHLILVTGRKPGQPVKFADVKEEVKEVYSTKLRDAVIAQMKPRAKIEITAVEK